MAQTQPVVQGDFSAKYTNLHDISPAILCAMLCGERRGDCVPRLFHDLATNSSKESATQMFLPIKEAISLIFPSVGLPNCIPACLGLVGELRSLDIEVPDKSDRLAIEAVNWLEKGPKTRAAMYRGVGNPEVHSMMAAYFPEISPPNHIIAYVTDVAVFGYLIGGSLEKQSLKQSELILASAITAMGATRQARSHCKASIGVGNSVEAVATMVDAAVQVAAWNKVNVTQLAQEIQANLALDHK